MDDEELAAFFSAKKENEELKEQVERLKIDINNRSIESQQKDDYRFVLINKLIDRDSYIDKLEFFISSINRFPYFWARTYRKYIKLFMEEHDIQ